MEEEKGESSAPVAGGGNALSQGRREMFSRSSSTPRRSSVGAIQVPGVVVAVVVVVVVAEVSCTYNSKRCCCVLCLMHALESREIVFINPGCHCHAHHCRVPGFGEYQNF